MSSRANALIEENYPLILAIKEKICAQYNIPYWEKEEVLSICHLAVVEATPKFEGENLEAFWYICCRNKVLDQYRKDYAKQKEDMLTILEYLKRVSNREELLEKIDSIISNTHLNQFELELIELTIKGKKAGEIMEILNISKHQYYRTRCSIIRKIRGKDE